MLSAGLQRCTDALSQTGAGAAARPTNLDEFRDTHLAPTGSLNFVAASRSISFQFCPMWTALSGLKSCASTARLRPQCSLLLQVEKAAQCTLS